VRAELQAFRATIAALETAAAESDIVLEQLCEIPTTPAEVRR
jgi:hypothetical protein